MAMYLSASELANLGLPNFPASERGVRARVEQEKWSFVERKSRGRLGIRREYEVPESLVSSIHSAKLVRAFNQYRLQVAAGEPLETAKAMFIESFNQGQAMHDCADLAEASPSFLREHLDEALRWRGLKGTKKATTPIQHEGRQEKGPATFAMYAQPTASCSTPQEWINPRLLWMCHDACLQVYGIVFAEMQVQNQIEYAADLYNLLVRLSAAKQGGGQANPNDFVRLETEKMGEQLKLFVQMGWVKKFPPSPLLGCIEF